mmetsp:Transcript_9636/g.13086  ORF Transcript_9636/g.13086 Transcript_9636/m.13086 type:complete len:203 (+) Transcript_9636:654-1262(+)
MWEYIPNAPSGRPPVSAREDTILRYMKSPEATGADWEASCAAREKTRPSAVATRLRSRETSSASCHASTSSSLGASDSGTSRGEWATKSSSSSCSALGESGRSHSPLFSNFSSSSSASSPPSSWSFSLLNSLAQLCACNRAWAWVGSCTSLARALSVRSIWLRCARALYTTSRFNTASQYSTSPSPEDRISSTSLSSSSSWV